MALAGHLYNVEVHRSGQTTELNKTVLVTHCLNVEKCAVLTAILQWTQTE